VKKLYVLFGVVLFLSAFAVAIGVFNPLVTSVYAQKSTCDPKNVDCTNPDCATDPACQKTGTGCSPGFYKNHPEIWTQCCGGTGQRTCSSLTTALNCKGSDASCGRSAAAAYLDACTGCSE
jgi:hypothetical protein